MNYSLEDLNLDYGLTVAVVGLFVAVVTLLASWLFFYHQNFKSKQQLCLNEIINRLELIIALVKTSFNPTDRHYEIYSEFTFHSVLLKYNIEKFNKSEPYITLKSVSKKNRDSVIIITDQLNDLIEYIDFNTPVESPTAYDINNTEEIKKIKMALTHINAKAIVIIKLAYEMI